MVLENQLVADVMHLHQPGTLRRIFEMQGDRLKHIRTELLPGIAFGEDRVTQRPRAVAAFFCVANLEDQLHSTRITGVMNRPESSHLPLGARSAAAALMEWPDRFDHPKLISEVTR